MPSPFEGMPESFFPEEGKEQPKEKTPGETQVEEQYKPVEGGEENIVDYKQLLEKKVEELKHKKEAEEAVSEQSPEEKPKKETAEERRARLKKERETRLRNKAAQKRKDIDEEALEKVRLGIFREEEAARQKNLKAATRETRITDAERRMKGKALESTPFEKIGEAMALLQSDPGFRDFFHTYGDTENFDVSERYKEVHERYDRYLLKRESSQKLNELFTKEIEKELSIELKPQDRAIIESFLNDAARENPGELHEFLELMPHYEMLQKRASEVTREIHALGGIDALDTVVQEYRAAGAKLEEEKERAERFYGWKGFIGEVKTKVTMNPASWLKAAGEMGWKFITNKNRGYFTFLDTLNDWTELFASIQVPGHRTEKERKARKKVRGMKREERRAYFQELDAKIAQIKKGTEYYSTLHTREAALKEGYQEVRRDFFERFEGTKAVLLLVGERAQEQLRALLMVGEQDKNLKDLVTAERYLAQVQKTEAEFGRALTDELLDEEYAKQLHETIREVSKAIVKDAVLAQPETPKKEKKPTKRRRRTKK